MTATKPQDTWHVTWWTLKKEKSSVTSTYNTLTLQRKEWYHHTPGVEGYRMVPISNLSDLLLTFQSQPLCHTPFGPPLFSPAPKTQLFFLHTTRHSSNSKPIDLRGGRNHVMSPTRPLWVCHEWCQRLVDVCWRVTSVSVWFCVTCGADLGWTIGSVGQSVWCTIKSGAQTVPQHNPRYAKVTDQEYVLRLSSS